MAKWLRWSWSSCCLWDSLRSVNSLKKGGKGECLEGQTLGTSPVLDPGSLHVHQSGRGRGEEGRQQPSMFIRQAGEGVRKGGNLSCTLLCFSWEAEAQRSGACCKLGKEVPALSTSDTAASLVFSCLALLPCSL